MYIVTKRGDEVKIENVAQRKIINDASEQSNKLRNTEKCLIKS